MMLDFMPESFSSLDDRLAEAKIQKHSQKQISKETKIFVMLLVSNFCLMTFSVVDVLLPLNIKIPFFGNWVQEILEHGLGGFITTLMSKA